MNRHIKHSEIGKFNSLEDAKAYRAAMNVKKEFKDVTDALLKYDDTVDIDFNNLAPGDIMLDDFKNDQGNQISGRIQFNTDSRELTSADFTLKYRDSTDYNHYTLTDNGNALVYEIDKRCPSTPYGALSSVISKVEIDKETGDIEYKRSLNK